MRRTLSALHILYSFSAAFASSLDSLTLALIVSTCSPRVGLLGLRLKSISITSFKRLFKFLFSSLRRSRSVLILLDSFTDLKLSCNSLIGRSTRLSSVSQVSVFLNFSSWACLFFHAYSTLFRICQRLVTLTCPSKTNSDRATGISPLGFSSLFTHSDNSIIAYAC